MKRATWRPGRAVKRPIGLVAAFLVVVAANGLSPQTLDAQEFQVVVHADNPTDSLSMEEISLLFQKKNTRWSSGAEIEPVNQALSSPVRSVFSRTVHGRTPAAMRAYWQRMVFSGRGVPPLEKTSDEDVLDYVSSHTGAIGYVSIETEVPETVKVLRVDGDTE